MTEQEATWAAARHGDAVGGLGAYRAGDPAPYRPPELTRSGARSLEHPAALVVGYATPPEHAYTGALARLTATLTARRVRSAGRRRAGPPDRARRPSDRRRARRCRAPRTRPR